MAAFPKPARIADQLRRAFEGERVARAGLLELLEDVDAATAAAKPLAEVHSIWELVLHVAVWDGAALVAVEWREMPAEGRCEFSAGRKSDAGGLAQSCGRDETHARRLVKTVAALPESRLRDRVPGKRYDFYHMLHGMAQHELYHAGQIAILKKAKAPAK